jgi:hypothetical protein
MLALAVPGSAQIELDAPHRVIARVAFQNRSYFEFVAGADGVIGVAEHSPAGAPSRLVELTAQNATPLEAYIAVAPASRPPDELVKDHYAAVEQQGEKGRQPRTLVVHSSSSADEDYDPGACEFEEGLNPGNSWFTRSWFLDIGMHQDFTAQQMYQAEDLNGTAGRKWLAGKSWQRWLGACNGTYVYGFPNLFFKAQSKSGGSWSTSYNTQIAPDFKVIYSSMFGSWYWRLKLTESDTYNVMNLRDYGAAVAGNEPIDSFTWR